MTRATWTPGIGEAEPEHGPEDAGDGTGDHRKGQIGLEEVQRFQWHAEKAWDEEEEDPCRAEGREKRKPQAERAERP